MDPDVLRLVRAVAALEQGPGIHPVGFRLEARLCDLLGVDADRLTRMVAKADAERCLVPPGVDGPSWERRRHPYHLSAKGWGLVGVLAA